MAWTLIYNGVEKTLDAWGIASLRRSLVSQGMDQVSFVKKGGLLDDAPIFPFESWVSIRRNGAYWFSGVVMDPQSTGVAGSESASYTVCGPWYYFTVTTFHQIWATWPSGGGSGWEQTPSTHVYLGQYIDWTNGPVAMRSGTAHALQQVCDWVLSKTNRFTVDASMPDVAMLEREERDITCAQALLNILRMIPDAVIYWDYSVATPILRIRRPSQFTAVNIPLGKELVGIPQFTARHDLQRTAVALKFERINDDNGTSKLELISRSAPSGSTGQEIGALCATIPLQGWSATMASGVVIADAMAISSADWWIKKVHWMADESYTTLEVVADSAVRVQSPSTYPNEMVDGNWAPWMGCNKAEDVVRAKIYYEKTVPGSETEKGYKDVSTSIKVTNAPLSVSNGRRVNTYSTLSSVEDGEAIPEGMEQTLYDAFSYLHYSGQFTLQERECGDWFIAQSLTGYWIGKKINITGSKRSEWASMGAIVQQVDEDIDSGSTTLTVGPPEHLSPQALAAQLSVTRTRYRWTNPATQGGTATGGGTVSLPESAAGENASAGGAGMKKAVVAHPDQAVGGKWVVDAGGATPSALMSQTSGGATKTSELTPGQFSLAGGGKTAIANITATPHNIAFREYKYCEDGVLKKVMLWGSEPYV